MNFLFHPLTSLFFLFFFKKKKKKKKNIVVQPENQSKYIMPLEEGVRLLLGCMMIFCLVVDLVILTTVSYCK
jgi:hypothetical protein